MKEELKIEKMLSMLQNFKTFNTWCCANNRLISDTIYYNHTGNKILYQFENQSYNIVKGQEFGYPIIPDFQFSDSGRYYFDFCVKDKVAFQKDDPLLVLKLYDNASGEQIFWYGLNIGEKQGFIHFPFDIQQKKEMTLKSYFWNNQLSDFNLPNTSCHFYRSGK